MNNIPMFTMNNSGQSYYGIRSDNLQNAMSDVITMFNMNTINAWNEYQSMIYLNSIILLLRVISGNNVLALINDIVTQNNNQLFKQLSPLNQYNNVINKLVEYNHDLNHLNRWRSLQFVVSDFDKAELKSFGFDCSKRSIRTALDYLATNNNKPLITKPNNGPTNVLNPEQIESIKQHYYNNSRPSPSEVLKIPTKKREVIVQKR